ncbi:MAG: hypothetical protein ACPGYV_04065 [Phycisphaeraceae bacterium]
MIESMPTLISNPAGVLSAVVDRFDIRIPASEIILAWRPFLDPAPIDRYWLWFLPPLILLVALVYRTIKSESLTGLARRAGYLAFQISVFMVLAAAALWLTLLFV